MGQRRKQDNIPPVVRASGTSLTLAASNIGLPTRITVGGQQYKLSSSITLNTGTAGFNGVDAGSFTAATIYNIFAVVSSGALGMVLSASTAPAGFSSYKFLGKLIAATGATISHVMNVGEPFIEYVFNTSGITAAGTSNTSAFGYGVDGAAIGNINSATLSNNTTNMQCAFLVNPVTTDRIGLQFADSVNWIPAPAYAAAGPGILENTANYGVAITSASQPQIVFGNAGRHNGGAYGAVSAQTWTQISTTRWRIVKESGCVLVP